MISQANYRMLLDARKLCAIVRTGTNSVDGQDGIGTQACQRCSERMLTWRKKSGLLIQGFLSDGKIFGAGKCESLEGNGVELDPQSGRFRRKQITVLHFERLA